MSPSPTIWNALKQMPFRALLGASTIFYIGNAMQGMAASWLMIQLTGSSFLTALVQTAVFLPMFLLAMPAGVLADITDRKRLIQVSLLTQAFFGTLMSVLFMFGWAGPTMLLLLTCAIGCCTAMQAPAWNTSLSETLPRESLPQATMAVSIAYNIARAAGPALAGVVFAQFGAGWVFMITVLSTLTLWAAVRRWPPAPPTPSRLPAERLWGGTLSGLRYAWHSEMIFAQLVRTAAFGFAGSALWALLPSIGQLQLGLGAEGFGLLMACLGTGAIAAGLLMSDFRARVGMEMVVRGSCVIFAASMLLAGVVRTPWIVYLGLVIGGGAWMSAMSTFFAATIGSAPPWVRSRATALHILSTLGSFAVGSAVWGAISSLAGIPTTLTIASLCLAAGLLLARRYRIRMGETPDVTPARAWDDLFVAIEPDPQAGPVAVELVYRIRAQDSDAFLDAVSLLRAPRQRDGATVWRVYADLSDPTRYVERFLVASWADYLHQRSRATLADQEIEARVRAFLAEGESVAMHHYIAQR